MGIVRAALGAAAGTIGDQFQEVVEPFNMGAQTLMTQGRIKNRSGFTSSDLISNGSCIHVYDNQFMILVDGGKIIDYTAEPGYFIVDNSSQPSLFQGQFKESLPGTVQGEPEGSVGALQVQRRQPPVPEGLLH